MAEVTNELMYETLKAVQLKLFDHDRRFDELATDLRSLKAHMAGFMSNEVNQDATIATLRERIERIERRLELTP